MNFYSIDAFGLLYIATIFYNKDKVHPLYSILNDDNQFNDRYISSEVSVLTAHAMAAEYNNQKFFDALNHICRYFFAEGIPEFELWIVGNLKDAKDFGRFVKDCGIETELHVVTTAFIAKEIYPGSQIIGKMDLCYRIKNLNMGHMVP